MTKEEMMQMAAEGMVVYEVQVVQCLTGPLVIQGLRNERAFKLLAEDRQKLIEDIVDSMARAGTKTAERFATSIELINTRRDSDQILEASEIGDTD